MKEKETWAAWTTKKQTNVSTVIWTSLFPFMFCMLLVRIRHY